MLLRDNLAHNARVNSRRPALFSESAHVSYADLLERTRRQASALHALGVRKGDRVAVLSRSTPSYIELLFAVTQLGAVLVPLNHLFVGREHRNILEDAGPGILLFEEGFQGVVGEIRPALPDAMKILQIGSGSGGFAGVLDEGRGETAPPPVPVPLSGDDIALQIYTSGTSGRPRGAMLSHGNLMAASASAAHELGLSRNDRFLSCTPLPFIAGTGRLLRFLYLGAGVVVMAEFDPEEALRAIERHGITHVLLTPAMMARILEHPSAGRFRLASLRKVLYGGSSIPLDLLKRAIRFFRCDMVQSYGQVESSGILTFLSAEDHTADESAPSMRKMTSVGKEAIGVEVRVVDEEGGEIAPNGVGEVTARGANIFRGYHRDPEFTAEVLRDGWLHTGDVGTVDEEGYLYLLDRKRDTLMIGGISVYPREIENVIAEHPSVAEIAVIPRPDYNLGEVPVAIVERKAGASAGEDDILDHCRRNMASFKVPHSIEFISSLPKNSAGKVLKAKLKEGMAGRDPTRRTPRP